MPALNKNPYGLRDGQIVLVAQLDENSEYGLRCKCICPSCGEPLEARIRMHSNKEKYFAHTSGADCKKGYESALHKLAKKIIDEGVEIKLPPISSSFGDKGFFIINNTVRFPASYSSPKPIIPEQGKTIVEKDMGSFRPDVSILYGGNELYIEIQVTHPVDDEKKELIKKANVSCVEFDFSYYKDVVVKESDIRKAFEGKDKNIEVRWIFNKVMEEHDSCVESHREDCLILDSEKTKLKIGISIDTIGYQHKLINDKTTANCPLRKHLDGYSYYANKDECVNCKFFSGFLFKLEEEKPFAILCRQGNNNISIRPRDACNWLIYSSKEQYLPKTEDGCKKLICSLTERLGFLANHPQVQEAKEQATANLLSRFEKNKARELQEQKNRQYRILYRKIYQRLDSLILWANSSYDVWSRYAFKGVKKDLQNTAINGLSDEEFDAIVLTLTKKVWDKHCEEGERLFKICDSFHWLIGDLLSQPVKDKEPLKDWLFRVTSNLRQKDKGMSRFRIPLFLATNRLIDISYIPFLEKAAKGKFE